MPDFLTPVKYDTTFNRAGQEKSGQELSPPPAGDDDIDPAIPILEERVIEIDSVRQFLNDNNLRRSPCKQFPL